jgi:hypothetical protein
VLKERLHAGASLGLGRVDARHHRIRQRVRALRLPLDRRALLQASNEAWGGKRPCAMDLESEGSECGDAASITRLRLNEWNRLRFWSGAIQ